MFHPIKSLIHPFGDSIALSVAATLRCQLIRSSRGEIGLDGL
jgi:hypothetical protein